MCCGTLPNSCYHPDPGHGFRRGVCVNHCEPKLYVDGGLQALPEQSRRLEYEGAQQEELLLLDVANISGHKNRIIELVMPFGGEIVLRGFRLSCTDGRVPTLQRPREHVFQYIAYGDSITQGYCAPTPYPEALGRMNGWNAINLGIGGLKTSASHGGPIGRRHAHLITMLIGTNDWWRGCDVGSGVGGTIDNIRNGAPRVPLVVITMLARSDEPGRSPKRCIILEDFRQQIRDEVQQRRARGDSRLYLVEGRPLLSLERLGDGLHPNGSAAMAELAANLNAEMGFSQVKYTPRCGPPLRVSVNGLSPKGRAMLYWGMNPPTNEILDAPCQAWSVMVKGSKIMATADPSGHTIFTIPTTACDQTIFQVVDMSTCTVSRIGRGTDVSSATDVAAENFHWVPPSTSPSAQPKSPSTSPSFPPKLTSPTPLKPALTASPPTLWSPSRSPTSPLPVQPSLQSQLKPPAQLASPLPSHLSHPPQYTRPISNAPPPTYPTMITWAPPLQRAAVSPEMLSQFDIRHTSTFASQPSSTHQMFSTNLPLSSYIAMGIAGLSSAVLGTLACRLVLQRAICEHCKGPRTKQRSKVRWQAVATDKRAPGAHRAGGRHAGKCSSSASSG